MSACGFLQSGEQDARLPEGSRRIRSFFFPSHMKCFYGLRHRDVEMPTKSIKPRPSMAFWLFVMAIYLLETVAVISVLRREWHGKEKTFTIDKIRR